VDNPADGVFPTHTDHETPVVRVYGGGEVLLWVEIVIVPFAPPFASPQLDHSNAVTKYIELL
jgi:hypothetical protein